MSYKIIQIILFAYSSSLLSMEENKFHTSNSNLLSAVRADGFKYKYSNCTLTCQNGIYYGPSYIEAEKAFKQSGKPKKVGLDDENK